MPKNPGKTKTDNLVRTNTLPLKFVSVEWLGSLKNFSGWDWSRFLRRQPEFADKCDWEKLSNENWVWLLRDQPQFSKYKKTWLSSAYLRTYKLIRGWIQ